MNRYLRVNRAFLRSFNTCNGSLLSGHNKWSSIKHDKAKNDAERNKMFSKFAQRISLAVKLGGSADPNLNIRLSTAIELASKNNVTKKVIENAIKKGSGASATSKGNMETCIYEGMGPGGVAFVVEALTDNKNRTIGLVRSAFTKANGSMTPTLYFFDRRGYVVVEPPSHLCNDEDELLEKVLEIDGVQDLERLNDTESDTPNAFEISTETNTTNTVATELKNHGFRIIEIGMEYVPKNDMQVEIDHEETLQRVDKFINVLDEIEDVTDVYSNLKH